VSTNPQVEKIQVTHHSPASPPVQASCASLMASSTWAFSGAERTRSVIALRGWETTDLFATRFGRAIRGLAEIIEAAISIRSKAGRCVYESNVLLWRIFRGECPEKTSAYPLSSSLLSAGPDQGWIFHNIAYMCCIIAAS